MPFLEIKNLQVEFGSGARATRAVNCISLSLEAGKTLCLVGDSGSGLGVRERFSILDAPIRLAQNSAKDSATWMGSWRGCRERQRRTPA